MNIFARRAFVGSMWKNNVSITLHDGHIVEISDETSPGETDTHVDTLLPALANLHSHSFQRAMAGMTEFRARGKESFWTWRELMYRFLERINPEQVTAIAAQTFMEMQKAGYASVGEFHYIHNTQKDQAYEDRAELSMRIFEAASQTGIGLTHLPVLYTYGGADLRKLEGGQLRFYNTIDTFSEIVERTRAAASNVHSDTRVGIAPHSLRAVSPNDLTELVKRNTECPIHIHISEQQKEVQEITSVLGARPVEWLLANNPVDTRWCLIHATHMSDRETVSMAQSGAVAGLCPITEANLGDGVFNGPGFLEAGGRFGIGSDSNINISLTEELRTLEYSQRLRNQQRNVLVEGNAGSTGRTIYMGAASGGAQAIGRNCGRLEAGALADLVAIDGTSPALCGLDGGQIFDGLAFAAKDNVVTDVWSAGRHQVKDGRHVAEQVIEKNYKRAIRQLISAT